MAYLSPAYLRRYDLTNFSNSRYLGEAKTNSANATVFLSHSSADDEHVDRVVLFFREFDAIVYADNYDKTLPKPPSPATATVLKDRIANTRRFVVLVSSNSRSSRWIPWEIGIADGKKGVAPLAILPVTANSDEETWTLAEYFGLYPRIRLFKEEWIVSDPRDNKYWSLKSWLHTRIE
jgi:hypothetical protein